MSTSLTLASNGCSNRAMSWNVSMGLAYLKPHRPLDPARLEGEERFVGLLKRKRGDRGLMGKAAAKDKNLGHPAWSRWPRS